jgi:iron uptake system component EfeO
MMLIVRGHHPGSIRSALALAVTLATPLCTAVVGYYPAAAEADNAPAAPLDAEIERYRSQLIEDIDRSVASVQKLRASVDLTAAKQAWIEARIGWERSEVFTSGFAPELDRDIDAWPAGATGFHAIEAKLFGAGNTDVGDDADTLVKNLDDLNGKLRDMPLTPQGLLDGTARLAYEVGESKADGGESRISGTSLADMRNNVAGIDLAYQKLFSEALKAADGKLDETVRARIAQLKEIVAAPDLPHVDVARLRRASEELVVALQMASARLGLQRPTLEAQTR